LGEGGAQEHEIDLTPPFKRIEFIPEIEKHLQTKLPSPKSLGCKLFGLKKRR